MASWGSLEMNRRNKKRPKAGTTRRKREPARPNSRPVGSIRKRTTAALRIEAQIAMLKRALLAADDEGLPHKAICDYLHTLSQMARYDLDTEPNRHAPDDEKSDVGGADGTVDKSETPPRRNADIRERLRQAIADIYGITASPSTNDRSPSSAADGGEK